VLASDLGTSAETDGAIVNTAAADSDQTDPVQDSVTVPVPWPNLSIVKEYSGNADEDGSGDISLGDTLSYTITATNTGTAVLTGVAISDALLGGLTCDQPVTLAPGDPGDSLVCTGTHVLTQDDKDNGEVENTATADSDQTDPVNDSVTVDVPQNPSISLVKSFTDDEVIAGDASGSSFKIEVTNNGDVTLSDVLVSDAVESMLKVTIVSTDQAPDYADSDGDNTDQTIGWSVGTLAVGQTVSLTVSFTVAASVVPVTGVLNTAFVTAEAPQGDPDDSTDDIKGVALDRIDIHTEIELSITKTFYRFDDNGDRVEDDKIEQGTSGYFELIVTNTGPSYARNVHVTDAVNGLLEVTTVTVTTTSTAAGEDCGSSPGQSIDCTIPTLDLDDEVIITVKYLAAEFLDPDEGPTYNNTQDGDEFHFVFVNGYTLEGSSDPVTATLVLIAPDGTKTVLEEYPGTKNAFTFDPPGDDSAFTMHISCSDPFTDGWGLGGGTNGPEKDIDVNWQIASYSILRYNQNGFFKGCGDVVIPWDVPNTAFTDGTDSNSDLGTDELETATAMVQIIRQLKIEIRNEPVVKGKKVDVLLVNTGEDVLTITQVDLKWPSENGNLVSMDFGAQNTIWEGSEVAPDATITDFIVNSGLTIDPGVGLKLGFFFQNKSQSGTYMITVTLEGGLTTEVTTITPDL